MARVRNYLSAQNKGSVLDIPAGGGQFTDAIRELGFHAVPADINCARGDFVFADMSRRLPFDDDQFNYSVCLEGIEHVLEPYGLMRELFRVTRPGGQIILSTPNIGGMYSRLQFLCTGTFYQFQPSQLRPPEDAVDTDRFHVSPMSLHTLRYFGESLGGKLVRIDGDKVKRLTWFPLYLIAILAGLPWSYMLFLRRCYRSCAERNRRLFKESYHPRALFSRSLIVVFVKDQRSDARS
jgi:SAM-dependent methyltransferase